MKKIKIVNEKQIKTRHKKTEKNILIAFILNLVFSIFEFVGGVFIGSIAIISDAVHDIGDATSICCSFILERKSKKQPDEKYTYGYARYSVLGGVISTLVLVVGSIMVIYGAIGRIINPEPINYNSMIIFAIVGVIVNFLAAFFTREGDSINQKAVNLHMLEDVLGWVVVLIGAVVMRFTNFYIIDPIMSIAIAVFIFIQAMKNIKEFLKLFLVKIPDNITISEIKKHILEIENVIDVHHIHVWTLDNQTNYATMHIVTNSNNCYELKTKIKKELNEHNISHSTLEFEMDNEQCECINCKLDTSITYSHHHHH